MSSTILREKRRPMVKQAFTHSLLLITVVAVVIVVTVVFVVLKVGLIGTGGLFRIPEPSAPEAEKRFQLAKSLFTHWHCFVTMCSLHISMPYQLCWLQHQYYIYIHVRCSSCPHLSINTWCYSALWVRGSHYPKKGRLLSGIAQIPGEGGLRRLPLPNMWPSFQEVIVLKKVNFYSKFTIFSVILFRLSHQNISDTFPLI